MLLTTETGGSRPTHSRRVIEEALLSLNPSGGNAFIVLEVPNGTYVQALGRQKLVTVETRIFAPDSGYRHYRYTHEDRVGIPTRIAASAGHEVDESEVLHVRDALDIFDHFRSSWGGAHLSYVRQDMTSMFTSEI